MLYKFILHKSQEKRKYSKNVYIGMHYKFILHKSQEKRKYSKNVYIGMHYKFNLHKSQEKRKYSKNVYIGMHYKFILDKCSAILERSASCIVSVSSDLRHSLEVSFWDLTRPSTQLLKQSNIQL